MATEVTTIRVRPENRDRLAELRDSEGLASLDEALGVVLADTE